MNQAELTRVLKSHAAWLRGESSGERADLRGANLAGANLASANLRYADLRLAYLRGAYLRYANLRGANLRGADLEGADLCGANLFGADLTCADLRRANLRDAYLHGADLEFTCVVGFQLCRYFGYRYGDRVAIGCEDHSLDYWLSNYKNLGRNNDYTSDEISLVGEFLTLMNKYEV